ncbi:transposase [Enterococcus cecorum]|uniref:transposase n=1 Tax=Enterococcus cecorum TaxID=44008 RepID=UPI0022D037C1|nr:transposase [Enterococcus cecorum]CAI3254417.1 transposase [Enterococcus cecorum]CAI3254727.1 transposase [Enterococcus cecorum]CAI3266210.1 transposase [Enterococcus cecorum]CAI3296678.1 transposase [Enterococcus cecorum]CAI3302283.1 transposase [Enterococcus cecorum]
MSSSEKKIERLTKTIEIQVKTIEIQVKTIEAMSDELALLREQVAYFTKKLYGKSSEQRGYNQNQLSLFDDIELPEEESDCLR